MATRSRIGWAWTQLLAVGVAAATVTTLGALGTSAPPTLRLAGLAGGAEVRGTGLGTGPSPAPAPGEDMAQATNDGGTGGGVPWHPVELRFVLADGVAVPEGTATAWRVAPPGNLGAAARGLADQLGLDAPTDGAWEGHLVAGAQDRTGPALRVGPTGAWSYDDPTGRAHLTCLPMPGGGMGKGVDPVPPTASIDPVPPRSGAGVDGTPAHIDPPAPVTGGNAPTPSAPDDRAAASDGSAGSSDGGVAVPDGSAVPCVPEPAPGALLSPEQATSRAQELFGRAGTPGTLVEVQASRDDWATYVSARIAVGGLTTDLGVHATYGQDGVLISASGNLGRLEEVGRYPTVDTATALSRLAGRGGWAGALPLPQVDLPQEAPPGVTPETTPGTTRGGGATPDAATSDLPADAPASSEVTTPPASPTAPEPEVMTITLRAVERALLLLHDVDGATLLVPGHRFTDVDGGSWTVLAVADGHLEVGAPSGSDGGTAPGGRPTPGVGGGSSSVAPAHPTEPAPDAPAGPGTAGSGTAGPGTAGSGPARAGTTAG